MRTRVVVSMAAAAFVSLAPTARAEQTLIVRNVAAAPVIDGKGDDKVWSLAKPVTTHDNVAGIDITLKAVRADKRIYFLVSFPDPDESREHKTWVWDKNIGMYRQGPSREDVFVFKWNMSATPTDLSIRSDTPHEADIWFWKACRSDPAGYADDKIQRLSETELPDSREMTSKSGKKIFLQRMGDDGEPASVTTLFEEYKGDRMPHFETRTPTGSRADIKAKGAWSKGVWVIEFGRDLQTGHKDDVQFEPGKTYQFGVSRYEMAGRDADKSGDQPLFGMGDVSENLILKFGD